MNYAEFKRLGLPLGSGVTEAACKTVLRKAKAVGHGLEKRRGPSDLEPACPAPEWHLAAAARTCAIQATDQPRTQPHMTSQPCQMAA